MNPERPKAVSLARMTLTPNDWIRPLVLAQGEQDPAGTGLADTPDADGDQEETGQAHVVVARL